MNESTMTEYIDLFENNEKKLLILDTFAVHGSLNTKQQCKEKEINLLFVPGNV
jgi:hypothetical protein